MLNTVYNRSQSITLNNGWMSEKLNNQNDGNRYKI